jgi:hypothetical protein
MKWQQVSRLGLIAISLFTTFSKKFIDDNGKKN